MRIPAPTISKPIHLPSKVSYLSVLLLLAAAGCSTVSPPPVTDRETHAQVQRSPAAPSAAPPLVSPPAGPGTRAPATATRGGAYYKDDGPGDSPPPDLDKIADARPRIEPLHRFANNPYNVFGQNYVPMRSVVPFRQSGIASWYGKKFHGQRTSSGEVYDMYAMTAAHPTLPIPSYVRVSNQQNGLSVVVRVNDRGPFHAGRVIDLSFAAAFKLGYVIAGSTPVRVELLQKEEIARLATDGMTGGVTGANPALTRNIPAAPAQAIEPPPPSPESAMDPIERMAGGTTPPVKPSAPVTAGSAATTGNVYLQLAAFSARDNAESFRARLYQEVGWLTDPIEISQRDGLYRLQLGPFANRDIASTMADRLRREIELRPVYVTR
jgi:rare lipoprotein A